jgi:hypothetical protein
MIIHGVHIALNINIKDCVERLCQNILDRHLRDVDLISLPQYEFATEVQGEQHEKYIKFFHKKDPNNFIKQQEWNQLKKELCKEN